MRLQKIRERSTKLFSPRVPSSIVGVMPIFTLFIIFSTFWIFTLVCFILANKLFYFERVVKIKKMVFLFLFDVFLFFFGSIFIGYPLISPLCKPWGRGRVFCQFFTVPFDAIRDFSRTMRDGCPSVSDWTMPEPTYLI